MFDHHWDAGPLPGDLKTRHAHLARFARLARYSRYGLLAKRAIFLGPRMKQLA